MSYLTGKGNGQIRRQYYWMFVAGVVKKRKRFTSVQTLSKKKTNQHRTFHLDPWGPGDWSMQMTFCHGCLKLYDHSKTHTYQAHTSFKWKMEKDNITKTRFFRAIVIFIGLTQMPAARDRVCWHL